MLLPAARFLFSVSEGARLLFAVGSVHLFEMGFKFYSQVLTFVFRQPTEGAAKVSGGVSGSPYLVVAPHHVYLLHHAM